MNREYPKDHRPPEKNLLLISCIDLRLTDDLVRFMDHENLTNRYDHVIMAGASLGISLGQGLTEWLKPPKPGKPHPTFSAWWTVLEEHIGIAVELHHIEDVYLVEHESCGAYKAFVDSKVIGDKEAYHLHEAGCQARSAWLLAARIEALEFDSLPDPYHLKVQCFRMDLRGNVSVLPKPKDKALKQQA